ncbi:MAG: hypothetical protein GKR91_15255 [Pseudomonadales bacterium]|nr:hypothetical protein [Pseudomonadales bacterium]
MSEGWWALLGVLVGTVLTGLFGYAMQDRQFKHNKEMYYLNNKSKEGVKDLLENMLEHRNHIARTFEALRKPIGGYTDEEIRQLLHELDAKKIHRKSDNAEMWYLLTRQDEWIERNRAKGKQQSNK